MIKSTVIDPAITKQSSSATGILLKIVNGNSERIQKSDIFRVTIPQTVTPRTTLSVGGQPFQVEGLPPALAGKIVAIRLAGGSIGAVLEILSSPAPRENPAMQSTPGTTPQPTPGTLLKGNPKEGRTMNGEQAGQRARQMGVPTFQQSEPIRQARLSAGIASLSPQQTKKGGQFQAVVINSTGRSALLQLTGHFTPKPVSPPGTGDANPSNLRAITSKLAHAVARTSRPDQLIKEPIPSPTLKIERLSSPVKLGEAVIVEVKREARAGQKAELAIRTAEASESAPQNRFASLRKTSAMSRLPTSGLHHASVKRLLPNGNYSIQWHGGSFEANSPQPLQKGDTLLIKISGRERAPSVEVLDVVKRVAEKAVETFRSRITQSEPLKQVLTTLLQSKSLSTALLPNEKPLPATVNNQLATLASQLDLYTLNPDRSLDGPRLQQMIQHSGIFLEAAMAKAAQEGGVLPERVGQTDLKAVLLKLIEIVQAQETTPRSRIIASASEQGANRIESQQAINLLSFQQAEPIRVEFPMLVQGLLSTVQMAISAEPNMDHDQNVAEESGSKSGFNILFALDLSALGNINIDARITTSSVQATIYAEQEQPRQFMQQKIDRLTERLESVGFDHVQLTTATRWEVSEDQLERFNRLSIGLPISKGLLDVTG